MTSASPFPRPGIKSLAFFASDSPHSRTFCFTKAYCWPSCGVNHCLRSFRIQVHWKGLFFNFLTHLVWLFALESLRHHPCPLWLSIVNAVAQRHEHSDTSTLTSPLCCRHPVADRSTPSLEVLSWGWASQEEIAQSEHFCHGLVAVWVGQPEMFSCPFNLVLASLALARAILNLHCSSPTVLLLYRENGSINLSLPATVFVDIPKMFVDIVVFLLRHVILCVPLCLARSRYLV